MGGSGVFKLKNGWVEWVGVGESGWEVITILL